MTTSDMAALRFIDQVSVSPDGQNVAFLVRQGDPVANEYDTVWYVVNLRSRLTHRAGDGGDVRYEVFPEGLIIGNIATPTARWSPDGRWFAYVRESNGERQVWRSRYDRAGKQQLTFSDADVHDFAWSSNGRRILFSVGRSRSAIRSAEREQRHNGYRYDELVTFSDFMLPAMRFPPDQSAALRTILVGSHIDEPAGTADTAEFTAALNASAAGQETPYAHTFNAVAPPVLSPNGSAAWLERASDSSRYLRVGAAENATTRAICNFDECLGIIERVWWSEDGTRVLFWRHEGLNAAAHAIYAWSPRSNTLHKVFGTVDGDLRLCNQAAADTFVCVQETLSQPAQLIAIDAATGSSRVLVDANPEFRNIRLGRVERIEWDTPRFAWNEPGGSLANLYAGRAYGYIIYPPDFDPSKRYPVFIDPYVAQGFTLTGNEHPYHVYAANGIIVLRMWFPEMNDTEALLGPNIMQHLYSSELDLPHLTMFMESTVRGLATAVSRGSIDSSRVGIGGVSHGTFVPLFMMQKHDLITAISISSTTWGPHEYYWETQRAMQAERETTGNHESYVDWRPRPEGPGREYWSRFDIADHVDDIEGPVLMNLAAQETYGLLRFIRHLRDADRPYDAYVYDAETHQKWQPAHLRTIMARNVDWFRFWLQDIEDTDPAKAEQYERWRELRALQCRNPRSLRAYCSIESSAAPLAR